MPGVIEFRAANKGPALSEHEAWLRRRALQVAAELPENLSDAEAILDLTKALLKSFLGDPKPASQ